jgi:hypothetical protein
LIGAIILISISVLLLIMAFVIRPKPGQSAPPQPDRRRDPGSPDVVVIDDTPIVPSYGGFGMFDSQPTISVDDRDDDRFVPGGGDFGGAGATGSWDDDGGSDDGGGGGDGGSD